MQIAEKPEIKPALKSLILLAAAFLGVVSFYFSNIPIPEEYRDVITPENFKFQVMLGPAILAIIALVLGHFTARRAGLETPVLDKALTGQPFLRPLTAQIVAGVIAAGAVYGVMFTIQPLLNSYVDTDALQTLKDFDDNLSNITKLFYGVFAEEIIMRWGLFGATAWVALKLTPKLLRPYAIGFAAFLAASLATALHAPTIYEIFEKPPEILVVYTNGLGFLTAISACVLVIARGLGAAMAFKFFLIGALVLFPQPL